MACTDPNLCVAVSKTFMLAHVYGAYAGAAVLLILIFVFWKTPALEFIIAIITGKSVAYGTNRSQQGKFHTAKLSSEGLLDIRKVGSIGVSENSHTIERTSGRPLYFFFGEFASTLPGWWVYTVNRLKLFFSRKKEKINNIEDLAYQIGLKFNPETDSWDAFKKPITQAGHYARDEEGQIIEIPIRPYNTIKMHDLANMFPFNITPSLIESKIVHKVAAKQKFLNALNTQFIIAAGIFLIIAVVAGYMAYKFFGGGAPEVHVVVDPVGNVLRTSTNLTG